jgi:hypothetical protein
MRRTSSFRPRGIGTVSTQVYASPVPTRVLQQPITRRVTDRSDIDTPGGIAIYEGFEFNRDLHECLDPLDSVMIVGTVETDKSMVA